MITYVEDSSNDEVEEMAPKSDKSLRELMKGRNKVSTPQEANKSKPLVNPPPALPQLPVDLGLKPVLELRRKRQHEVPDEGEIGPSKGNKQQKVTQDQRGKGPLLLRAERGLSQLMCAEHPAYGPLSWS